MKRPWLKKQDRKKLRKIADVDTCTHTDTGTNEKRLSSHTGIKEKGSELQMVPGISALRKLHALSLPSPSSSLPDYKTDTPS